MYHIIVNSTRLKGKNADDLQVVKSVFDRAGKEYTIHKTEGVGHARQIAEEITSSGEFVRLIAMGGDGTLHEVLNGIKYTDKCHLGVIPVGTGNDFAAAAHIPSDAKEAAQIIAFRAPSDIDYIQLDSGLRSINAVGAGMDVDILKRTYSGKYQGKNKYYISFIKSLCAFKSIPFTVKYDGKEEKHFGLIACLGNGTQIGGGIKLFPDAKLNDGYMDLIIVDYLSRFKTLKAFLKLSFGKLQGIKEITQVRCKEAQFILEGEHTTIQAEGELYEDMPLNAKLISGKLKFYLPEND